MEITRLKTHFLELKMDMGLEGNILKIFTHQIFDFLIFLRKKSKNALFSRKIRHILAKNKKIKNSVGKYLQNVPLWPHIRFQLQKMSFRRVISIFRIFQNTKSCCCCCCWSHRPTQLSPCPCAQSQFFRDFSIHFSEKVPVGPNFGASYLGNRAKLKGKGAHFEKQIIRALT